MSGKERITKALEAKGYRPRAVDWEFAQVTEMVGGGWQWFVDLGPDENPILGANAAEVLTEIATLPSEPTEET